ncbi:RNA polymerase sigma factor SigJ [Phytomonospora endophytica]|uniref:RNA polymerase sigma-70 factor (ECF subfamily) n=1 Tax=Phytomonospora endophytica TaxID=714109 RepID=A0A841FLH7_9ACTN|nr:RNA polymerase sigma factor SigJ [Phytomonospora endophytica]MBB6034658.1 RNA polymerase sigma-70 factor (ECF subfamily) [Phytomonospora endophytica]
MALSTHEVDLFEGERARLEAIAYRLLGSAGDAEDVVQDTFLRWQSADREHVEVPAAWLTKVLTNICLNQLTSARAKRVSYVGQWLPEPVLSGDRMLGPADTAEQRESVSFAVLTLMERLSANERVVYVLREAFGHPHAEIAEMLDTSEANCQQIYRRAKQHLATRRARAEVDRAAAHKIAEEFLAAAVSGQTALLVRLLTDDARSIGDGGGKVPARTTPIIGGLTVARFLRGLFKPSAAKRAMTGGSPAAYAEVVNGEPAVVVLVGEHVMGVATLELTDEGITAVHLQVNPDKLARITRQWAATEHEEPVHILW